MAVCKLEGGIPFPVLIGTPCTKETRRGRGGNLGIDFRESQGAVGPRESHGQKKYAKRATHCREPRARLPPCQSRPDAHSQPTDRVTLHPARINDTPYAEYILKFVSVATFYIGRRMGKPDNSTAQGTSAATQNRGAITKASGVRQKRLTPQANSAGKMQAAPGIDPPTSQGRCP